MSGAPKPAPARRREWSEAQDDTLIATWRAGRAAASRAVSEVSRREGGPARSVQTCQSRVVKLRKSGVRIEGLSAAERGRLAHTGAGAGGSALSTTKPGNDPAARAAAAARAKRRRCLKCRQFFDSEGPGNRVCASCKNAPVWRDGAGMGL